MKTDCLCLRLLLVTVLVGYEGPIAAASGLTDPLVSAAGLIGTGADVDESRTGASGGSEGSSGSDGSSGSGEMNAVPTISGSPSTTVVVGNGYAFTPTAADDDALTFSVSGQPSWASFEPSTGRLSGTPRAGDVGTYSNIVVSVSDGETSVSLPSFSITVAATANGAATLDWVPPQENTDGSQLTDLAGYTVHWGSEPGLYAHSVDVGPGITSYVVENLTPGTWYFATRAYNDDGASSRYSNEASKTIQ